MNEARLHGIAGEFEHLDGALGAARQLRDSGFTRVEAYSPYPVEELAEAVGRSGAPIIAISTVAFLGALIGLTGGYFVQYWTAAVDLPVNVGGRPLHSWPAFTVSTFEIGVLCGVAAALLAFLVSSRLPLLYHPIFATDGFERASQDRFFLIVEAADVRFYPERIRAIFERHGAAHVSEVRG
ncbi:MAG: DUF3341 domain-containing protein [Alphaproteobacteria bacterium]|nr:DUF3341 domain-containing protein [Alphaproteobacteria bacterium]